MNKTQEYFKEEYSRKSSFENIFGNDYAYVNTSQHIHWNKVFQQEMLLFLKRKNIIDSIHVDLRNLHNIIDSKYMEFETITGEANNTSRPLIEDVMFDFAESQEVKNLYYKFMNWVYTDVIKEDFYFQKIPTFRVRTPSEKELYNTLPAWHADGFFGHSPREMNIWFGLTDNLCSGFWLKTIDDSRQWFEEYSYDRNKWREVCFTGDKDFEVCGFQNSHETKDIFNSVLFFDSRCIHSGTHRSEPDLTTKFSMDVRLILVDEFEWLVLDDRPVFKGTGFRKAEFRPGTPYGYHHKSIKQLFEEV